MPSQIRTGIRVLVLDDRRGNADLLAGILHMSGFDARVLYGAADAIRVVRDSGRAFSFLT